ncbi:MAG: hypothetical protein M1825_002122 [Sarcosagium campestre]|nr:MAG: hypothetical protein M1825_002122 [Sarcosagium campestre]
MPAPSTCCRARAQGECNCERANDENTVSGATCECGLRQAGACTCEKAADGGLPPTEIDFTGKA